MFDSKEFEIGGLKITLTDGEMQRVFDYYLKETIKDIIRDVALEEYDIDIKYDDRLTEKDLDYITEAMEDSERIYEELREMAKMHITAYL